MTQSIHSKTGSVYSGSLGKRMLVGAGIAFVLIAIFLLGAGEPNPEWSKLWRLRPLLVVPFAGAMGGLFYHLMDHLRYHGGWRRVLGYALSTIVYVFGLWIGTVLGLAGTYWH
ncbi:MAG TPA: potassium transporter KefB [Bacteroidia bacterium]|nr:potassium transporter KefB [Bacteroidia bacterium]